MEGICRRVGRNAREWAESVRSVDELADETGFEAVGAHRRPMMAIKAEKKLRARCFP